MIIISYEIFILTQCCPYTLPFYLYFLIINKFKFQMSYPSLDYEGA